MRAPAILSVLSHVAAVGVVAFAAPEPLPPISPPPHQRVTFIIRPSMVHTDSPPPPMAVTTLTLPPAAVPIQSTRDNAALTIAGDERDAVTDAARAGRPWGLEGSMLDCGSGGIVAGVPAIMTATEIPPLILRRAPIRLHAGIAPPRKLRHVEPMYPRIADVAHIEGVVVLDAIVDEHGHVTSAAVVRSAPTPARAAEAAVRQWRFTPTLLNGVPVPIVMTVTVNFRLPDR